MKAHFFIFQVTGQSENFIRLFPVNSFWNILREITETAAARFRALPDKPHATVPAFFMCFYALKNKRFLKT